MMPRPLQIRAPTWLSRVPSAIARIVFARRINKAISLNPRDPDYFRERSSLYAKRKEYPRAIADLTTAIGLAKKPMREYFLRGAAYEDIGQRDKAIADFQASLVLDPDNDVLRRHLVHLGGGLPRASINRDVWVSTPVCRAHSWFAQFLPALSDF